MLAAMMGGGGISLDIRCAPCAAEPPTRIAPGVDGLVVEAPGQPVTIVAGTLCCAGHAGELLSNLDRGHIAEQLRHVVTQLEHLSTRL